MLTAVVAAVQSSGEVMNTSVSVTEAGVAAGSGLAVSAGMAADSAAVGAARDTAPTTAH